MSQLLKASSSRFGVAGIALVSVLGLACGGALADQSEALEYLNDARSYLEQGDVRAAIIQLKNAVRADPDNGAARFALGEAYIKGGDPVSAEKELRLAGQHGIAEERVAPLLAQALVMQNKVEEMLQEVPRGQRAAAAEGEVLLWHGYGHSARGAMDAAVAAFTEAARLLPEDPRPRLGLAQLAIQRRDLDQAAAAAAEAVRLSQSAHTRAEALALQGEIKRLAGDDAAAARLFDEALLANPANQTALVGRAMRLLAAGNSKDAEPDVRRVLEANPLHPVATYLLAVIQAERQQFDQALDTLGAKVVDRYPPALFLKATVHYKRSEFDHARSAIERYMALAGRDVNSQRLLGSIMLRQHDAEAAVPVLEAAAAAAPDDPQILGLLASAHMQRRDNEAAAQWLDKALEKAPKDAATLTRFALGQLHLGETDEAIATLESAAALDPDAKQALLLLAVAHLQGGGYDEALAAAAELERQMPDSPVPHNMAGGAHFAKKDFAAARAAFDAALAKDPDFTPAILNLARLERHLGNTAAARALCVRATEADAKGVRGYLGLAELDLAQGDKAAALGWLDKAIAAAPAAPEPRLQRIAMLLDGGEAQKALAAARELMQVAPDNPSTLTALAKAQWAAGELASAVTTLRRLANLLPASPQVQVELGRALVRHGNHQDAAAAFQRASQIDDSYLPAHAERAALAYKDGDKDEAGRIARSWSERHPQRPEGAVFLADILDRVGKGDEALGVLKAAAAKQVAAPVAMRLSEMLAARGQAEEAVATLRAWSEAAEDPAPARTALGNLLLRLKRYDAAMAEYEPLAGEPDAGPTVLNNLAWLYGQKGDPRALALAERAHRLAPKSPEVADTLGYLLVRDNQVDRGLALLQRAHEKLKAAPEVRFHLAVALDAAGRRDEARRLLADLVAEQAQFEEAAAAQELHRRLAH